VLGGLCLASVVSTGVITFLDQLPPTLLFDNPDPLSRKPFGNVILVKPYPHAAPYLIGMLTGYFLHTRSDFKLGKWVTTVGWLLAFGITFTATFGTWEWNSGFLPSHLLAAIYAALFRGLWAVAMAWVIIACHYGKGGIVNNVLSWEPFIAMSRVSYTAYLIHPGLMYVFVASTRSLFLFSHYLVIYLFFAHLLTTFAASFLLSLIIEIPFCALERVIYMHLFKDTKSKNKYYYSVNPISPQFLGMNAKAVNELASAANGSNNNVRQRSNTTSNGDYNSPSKRDQLPLTEKLSINSTDSKYGLIYNTKQTNEDENEEQYEDDGSTKSDNLEFNSRL
jgi:hypothetical protein